MRSLLVLLILQQAAMQDHYGTRPLALLDACRDAPLVRFNR